MTLRKSSIALVALAAAAGCGGGNANLSLGDATERAVVVDAPGQPAREYSTTASANPVVGGAEATAMRRGVEAAATRLRLEIHGDGRLALLAGWIAERLSPSGEPPPNEVVELFARHLGLVEPVPHLIVIGQPDPSALEASIADSAEQFFRRQSYDHWGGVVSVRDGLTVAVVVLSERQVTLDPVPRHVEPGRSVRVRGRLGGTLLRPSLAITHPDGEVERLTAGAGPELDVPVPLRDSGVYRVELLAEGERGDLVVANFPIYVGVAVATSVTLNAADEPAQGDVRGVEQALLRLLNESRRRAGRAEVAPTTQLDELARAHSRDMVQHGFVGHTSPTTGTAAERVQRAGVATGLVLENIGRGYGANEIHRGLLESPGHRANIVNPDVTHVGIGVVADDEGSRTAYVVTEVFVRQGGEVDLATAPGQVLAMINRSRAARGAPPLAEDPNLARAAADGARRYFHEANVTQQDIVDDASTSLRRFAIAFRRLGGAMLVATNLDDAARLDAALDPDQRYVGIGVARGRRDSPVDTLAIVIIVAWPR